MATCLVTYDLHDPQYEADLLKYTNTGEWALLTESTYAIVRDDDPDSIRDEISTIAHGDITLLVITIARPWASRKLDPDAVTLFRSKFP